MAEATWAVGKAGWWRQLRAIPPLSFRISLVNIYWVWIRGAAQPCPECNLQQTPSELVNAPPLDIYKTLKLNSVNVLIISRHSLLKSEQQRASRENKVQIHLIIPIYQSTTTSWFSKRTYRLLNHLLQAQLQWLMSKSLLLYRDPQAQLPETAEGLLPSTFPQYPSLQLFQIHSS